MYTQCPQCLTLFRVHSDQLKAAHGRVRCGRCRGVFDALANLREDSAGFGADSPDEDNVLPSNRVATTSAPHVTEPHTQEAAPLPFEVPDDLPDIPAASEDADGLPPPGRRRSGRLYLKLGVLALTGLLIVQIAWSRRESLAVYPQGRYLLNRFCALARCTPPLWRAPEQIHILSREVRLRPDRDDSLLVRLDMVNGAPFPQPYPLVQLALFTGAEKRFAQRRFRPEEYLPPDVQPGSLWQAGQSAHIELELVDPGQPVSAYRFSFFEP